MPVVLNSLAAAVGLAAAVVTAPADVMPAFPDTSDRALIVQWLTRQAGIPQGTPLDLGADSAVAILTDSTDGLREGLHAVTFREEAITVDFVARSGGRSISGSGTVDCPARQLRAGALTVFHGTGLRGERVNAFPAQETWRTPPAGSLLERVVENVCDSQPAAASPPPPAAEAAPAPPPSPAAAAPGPAVRGEVMVQVGAFARREQAMSALSRAMRLAAGELDGRLPNITSAEVNGARVYRALIDGFPSRTEAQAFCTRLEAKGQACLVRP